MANREVISAADLIEVLNLELSQREECAGCCIAGSLERLAEPYPDGGNWSRNLAIRGRPANPQMAGEVAIDVIVLIAERFNLE